MEKIFITREEVIRFENKLLSAQLGSHVDVLNELLHDDLIGIAPSGQTLTKDLDIDSYREGTIALEDASIEIEEIQIIGNTAISIVLMKGKGKVMGKPLEGSFRYLRVWKRFDNSLKIIGASFIQLA